MIKLVQGLAPVEEQIIEVIDRWNELDIVVDLRDVQHRFKLMVHSHNWHCWRKFFLFGLLLPCGRTDRLA